jgi:hypothetical protein
MYEQNSIQIHKMYGAYRELNFGQYDARVYTTVMHQAANHEYSYKNDGLTMALAHERHLRETWDRHA